MLVAMGLFEAGKGLQCPMHHIMQGACIQPHDLLKQITMLSRHLTLSRAPQCAAPARGGRQRRAGVWLVAFDLCRALNYIHSQQIVHMVRRSTVRCAA